MGRSGDRLSAVPDEGLSFEDFARAQGLKPRIKVCTVGLLPEDVRLELERAWAIGHRMKGLNEYLAAVRLPSLEENWTRKHFREHKCGCYGVRP